MANQASSFLQGTASGTAAAQAAAATNTDTNALANVNDLFDGLLEFQWRSIGFPIVETELELRQDLAIHKFVDRDGAHIEGTGRAPLQFTARIPFINGLAAGKNEKWVRPLYPNTWKRFFAACADRSSGILQHPELGTVACKCLSAHTRWSGDVRLGVFVNVTWLETDDDFAPGNLDLATPSPLASALAAASDLDAQLLTLNPAITRQLTILNPALTNQLTGTPFQPPVSFTDLMRSVRAVVDIPTLLQKQFAGRIDNLIYQAQTLEDSLNTVANANAQNWPLIAASERLKSALYDVKATQLTKGRQIGNYVTLKPATMAQNASIIGTPITDLMSLNPALVQFPVVPKDSVLRYYVAA